MNATQSTPAKCEFCGRTLSARTVTVLGKAVTAACYGSCGCDRSAEKLERMGPIHPHHEPSGHRCPKCGASMLLDGATGYVSDCPECGHSMVFAADLRDHLVEDSMARKRSALEGTGCPRLYWDVAPDYERAAEIMRTGKGYFITGRNSGTCKTLEAAAIAKAYAESVKTVRFLNVTKLLTQFKDAYGNNRPESEVFDELESCDLLVIDDMGKENATSWASTILYAVIDGRYGEMKPVIVTSNYSEGELIAKLAETYDDSSARAIVSRMCEMTEKVVMDGPDRRLA